MLIRKKTKENFYQDFFKTELIELCSVMEGAATNPMFKATLDSIKKTAPMLIHECPYEGYVNATGVVIDTSKGMEVLMSGIYKLELFFYKKNKTPLGKLRFNMEYNRNWDKNL